MDYQRIILRSALGGEYLADGDGVEGVCRKAVDRLGRYRCQTAVLQYLRSLFDIFFFG